MMNFLICGRRRRDLTRQQYFYEWGIIHVVLGLVNTNSQTVFKRYVQHYQITGVTNDQVIFPFSEMDWDNYADHVVANFDDMMQALVNDAYITRVKPHVFGDKEFKLSLSQRHTLFEKKGFRTGGGVKLIHWVKKKAGMDEKDFQKRWRDEYAAAVLKAAEGKGLVRKYVHNHQVEIDMSIFKGSLFEKGGAREYAGTEEIWFDDLATLTKFCNDPAIRGAALKHANELFDVPATYSMVTTERVIWDYITPGEMTPKAAILDPNSLEARVNAQGSSGWDKPTPTNDKT